MSSRGAEKAHGLPRVRACIFDVDGLLINSEDIYTSAYNNILHEYNRPDLPWSVKARQMSRGRQGTLRLLEWAQLPISLEEWTSKVSAQRELFTESEMLPGVSELLQTLSERASPPVYMALATSAGRGLFEVKTNHLPALTKAFPERNRVFGDDPEMATRAGKPAPHIFLLALQKINEHIHEGEEEEEKQRDLIKPEECLVFEDSIAGVEAGRKAGMRVVWVPHPRLLEVCKGMEEKVLTGTTEEEIDEERLRPVQGKLSNEDEKAGELVSREHKDEQHQQAPISGPWLSKDGKAMLLTSLEEFPYMHYSIHVADAPSDAALLSEG